MPGIVGIVSGARSEEVSRDLDAMIVSMMHEPYYTTGKWVFAECGLHLGWVSCNESSISSMPCFSQNKNAIVVLSGDVFSGNEFRCKSLSRADGSHFTDGGYWADLYQSEGDDFFSKLNGWFGGVVVDQRQKCVILFNDRYGMHRIYYHEGVDELLFASEAKALLAVRENLRGINYESLGQLFSCDCVLENKTLFSGVGLVPGGSAWRIDQKGRRARKLRYFDNTIWERLPKLTHDEFLGRFVDTFRAILPRYLVPNHSIGISLTSGLDSRMIMAWLDDGIGPVPCYTFSGVGRVLLDARIAQKVAQASDKGHVIISLGKDFLSDFPHFAEKTVYVTDGCHDVCGSHDIYLNERARKIAPVRVTGKYGSEVVRNNSVLKKSRRFRAGIFTPEFGKYLDEAKLTLQQSRRCDGQSFAVFKELPWHEYGRLAAEQSKLNLRTPYMDNDLVSLMYQAPADLRGTDEIPLRVVKDSDSSLMHIMTDRGQNGNPSTVKSKARRFLYYLLFKAEYIRFYQTPPLLNRLESAIGRTFTARGHLSGRYQMVNYNRLFREELSSYIGDVLLDRRTLSRPYLNPRCFKKMIERYLGGKDSCLNEINKVLSAELIHRQLLERFA